jgi:HK97 family phage portal protein
MPSPFDRLNSWLAGERVRADAPPAEPDDPDPVGFAIARAIEDRIAAFSLADALALPAVQRAVDLLCSQAASLQPVVLADGLPLDRQPRLVTRPTPWAGETRHDFVYGTMNSLLTGQPRGGNAYWLTIDRDDHDNATSLLLLDPADVAVSWDELRLRRRYQWRGQDVDAADLTHIRIGAKPGELLGMSPLVACLTRLAIIGAAETYAAGFFASGGIPEVVIQSGRELDHTEAVALRSDYIGDGERFPVRVVSGDLSLDFPGADPERAQMSQTRAYAATEVARLLGIPAPLLLVETSGSTITYQNGGQALTQLYRETLYPTYLDPIQLAWSDLTPRTQSVRFDLRELLAADVVTRSQVELAYVGAGVLDPTEVRVLEGWPADEPISQAARYQPTPRPTTLTPVPSIVAEAG